MNTPLIIITGPPGSGKTTLGRRLAKDLRLPFLSKDNIKEMLFDSLGWVDREWSMKVGRASIEILFYVMENELKARCSFVAETAFIPYYHTLRLLELQQTYPFFPIQIYVTTRVEVLYERFHRRALDGERHPGHFDQIATFEQFAESMQEGKYGVLEIGGALLEVDTSDWDHIDYEGLLSMIRTSLSKENSFISS